MSSRLARIGVEALHDELFASRIYLELSRMYGEELSNKLRRLSEIEKSHAEFWRRVLRKRGVEVDSVGVSRAKILVYKVLFRLIGLGLTLRLLEMDEVKAVEMYSMLMESGELSEEEKAGLRKILEDELLHEQEFSSEKSRFEEFLSHIREAVLGMNDGLVEVLSVTAGLSGAYGAPLPVALGGFIVGVAGALSMGVGAFVSAKSQREVHVGVLRRVTLAARYVGHLLRERVRWFMSRKGFSEPLAEMISREAGDNPKLLSRIVSEEEYGIREEGLENPGKAGLYTGAFYLVGALIPILPYLLPQSIVASTILSFLLAGVALGFVGFLIAVTAGISARRKIFEMVLSGLGSALATYMIGRLASITLGIEVE